MATANKLDWQDVERLRADRSDSQLTSTVEKVVAIHGGHAVSEGERAEAEAIFRVMVKDTETRVRKALAEVMKSYDNAPHDVVKSLAGDIDDIAIPVIASSVVLTDDDLIEVVESRRVACQMAVASRSHVSGPVSDRIAVVADGRAVELLAANQGAEVGEDAFHAMIERFSASPDVTEAMVKRSALPVSVAERLVRVVSESLRAELVARHELSDDVASTLIEKSRERATLDLSETASGPAAVGVLVSRLADQGRLTDTILMRALYTGDFNFFETGLARRAGIGVAAVHRLLRDGGEAGIRGLCDKASLPETCYPFVLASIELAEELEFTGAPNDRERYRSRLAERLLSQFGDNFGTDNVEYVLDRTARATAA